MHEKENLQIVIQIMNSKLLIIPVNTNRKNVCGFFKNKIPIYMSI